MMMQSFAAAVVSLAAIASAQDSDPNWSSVEFDMMGYCIGFSPKVYGDQGLYVQSDVQFAQQVADDIMTFHGEGFAETLESLFAMDVGARFFVSEGGVDPASDGQYIAASGLHMNYGRKFQDQLDMANNEEPLDPSFGRMP